jgi:hypothetical protein
MPSSTFVFHFWSLLFAPNVLYQNPSYTLLRFIEVPVTSQESERCIIISILPLFLRIFELTVLYFLFFMLCPLDMFDKKKSRLYIILKF